MFTKLTAGLYTISNAFFVLSHPNLVAVKMRGKEYNYYVCFYSRKRTRKRKIKRIFIKILFLFVSEKKYQNLKPINSSELDNNDSRCTHSVENYRELLSSTTSTMHTNFFLNTISKKLNTKQIYLNQLSDVYVITN